jgi:hypothetical protein
MDAMHRLPQKTLLAALLSCGLLLSACKTAETKPAESAQPAEQAPTKAEAPVPAAQPTPAPAAAQKPICKDEPKTTSKKTKAKTAKTAKATEPIDCIPASQAAAAPAAAPAPAPAPEPAAAQAPSASGSYNLSKNKPVTDSTKVEAGQGTAVKGINDWEGEITGVPAAGSKFAKLKIGMSREEVYGLVGQPTDQGAYVTGKAWIPFYHGSDRVRWEAVYKGHGRLIFSQQAGWASSDFHLTWIIHSANERGYR